jgi:hypothetical protein
VESGKEDLCCRSEKRFLMGEKEIGIRKWVKGLDGFQKRKRIWDTQRKTGQIVSLTQNQRTKVPS